ncbi:MAG: hypothetical protein ACK4F7_08180 [Inhella sp.]
MSGSSIRATGTVLSSRKYSDAAGNAVHELLITQGPQSLPILARRTFGARPADHIAACGLERHYRPGQCVAATGRSLRYQPRRALLELVGADHLEAAASPEPAIA